MVVEIFVTLAQRIHALAQQGQLVVSDIATIAGIREPCIDGFEQPQPLVSLPEQQQATITGDIPTEKSGLDPVAFYRWKVEADLGTFCHGQSPVRIHGNQLNFTKLFGLCPFYL